ncbi:alpha/beta fold hydrolase [Streptomyces sp. TP-A0874]|uniref:alpha/beta fold hydrolase n=1 Tax=Streptomyces sp. TP-A0874 TaxID=549819 RepID=UPI000852F0A1|nr:alpha/beta hydrolase [Streptomyces sp. TP-A0874]
MPGRGREEAARRQRAVARRAGRYAPPLPERVERVASADGTRIHVEVYGPDGAPAVVLAHGWTCSTAFWAAVVRELAAEYRVVCYDQRGHGRSQASATGRYSTRLLADDLEAVLRVILADGQRAVVAGHSMGGMTLMAAAGRPVMAEHVAAAVLCNTGSSELLAQSVVVPLPAGRVRTAAHRALLGSRLPLGPVTALSRALLKRATMGPGATREQVETCARIVHACPRGVRAGWARQVLAELDVDSAVPRLTMPTAVVTGTADRLTPPPLSDRLMAALPDCVGLTTLPGLGHMTPIEAPEVIAGLIRELAAEHLAGPPGLAAEAGDEPTEPKESA